MLQSIQFPSSGYNPQAVTTRPWKKKRMRAKRAYLRWLNRNHPKLLRELLDRANVSKSDVGLSGMGQANPAGPGQETTTSNDQEAWYDKLLNLVPTAVATYGAFEQQKELIKINERRAKQGLPPLEQAPTIKVQGEAGPETRRAVQEGITAAAGQYIPYILLGVGAYILTRPKSKRR